MDTTRGADVWNVELYNVLSAAQDFTPVAVGVNFVFYVFGKARNIKAHFVCPSVCFLSQLL